MTYFALHHIFSHIWQILWGWISWAAHTPPPKSPNSLLDLDSAAKAHRDASLTAVPLADQTDLALVKLALKRGTRDERPFRELFQRHQKSVWHICYRFVNNAQDAEDLTQEVFFKVYRNLGQFKGNSAFKTWLHRIAVNTCQSELRRRSRRPQQSEAPVETMAEYLPSTETPESSLRKKTREALLAQSFAQLKESEYEVLHLRELEKRSYADIAEILGISLSAAKMRVQRARLTFQAIYQKLEA